MENVKIILDFNALKCYTLTGRTVKGFFFCALKDDTEEDDMPITEFLVRNAELYPNEVCLVEINPAEQKSRTWREYELIESDRDEKYRREMTWEDFDRKSNRFANLLLSRGVKKGDKVAILLMNCLEWLPIYFGVLKTGALAVPMNYRYRGHRYGRGRRRQEE